MDFEVIRGGTTDSPEVRIGGKLPPKCVVNIDNVKSTFTDFVVVGFTGSQVSIVQNADTMTLAVALELIRKAFCKSYEELNENDRKIVDDFFNTGGANIE